MHKGFAKWAIIGAATGLIVAGMNIAIGQERPKYVTQPIDGLRYTAVYDHSLWPEMTFTLWVDNVDDHARKVDVPLKLVRQEFKGNPGGRVMRPEDFVTADLEAAHLTGQIPGNGTRQFTVRLKYRPDTSAPKGGRPISYILRVESGPKPLPLVGAGPLLR